MENYYYIMYTSIRTYFYTYLYKFKLLFVKSFFSYLNISRMFLLYRYFIHFYYNSDGTVAQQLTDCHILIILNEDYY